MGKPTEQEIKETISEAIEDAEKHFEQKSYTNESYCVGVVAALRWVIGEDSHPLRDE